ncbi:MAG: hypothetical protein A3K19_24990 [Lentisphaerae bacterium RIFOXYB12_FULL_65_16]|nr:MAG: hypothetical protein A3K18_26610 [Lentisphaerae bacterium RIFOXYA12_64_32]OGV91003.1 MAG: hypothetical protein A3K19_24990 [Lentisphaerae bacterium RIFOXYB12_FULL_65_16]
MAIDHDQVFKTLIREFFREFIELFLPEQAATIDFRSIQFLDKEEFLDLPRGRKQAMDLVVQVRLKGGGRELILVHTEFQSQKEAEFPRRMCQYYCQLFLRHGKPIVPIGLFSDDREWRRRLPDGFNVRVGAKTYLAFQYHLIRLRDFDARLFLRQRNPLAFALAAKMKYSKADVVRMKADFLRMISGSRVNAARRSLLVDFVETYTPLDPQQERRFETIIKADKKYAKVGKMITVYEKRGIQKGRREGRQEGRQEGMVQAKRDALLLLMRRKFRFVDAVREQQVQVIDSVKKLDALLLAVIDAQNIDDLDI